LHSHPYLLFSAATSSFFSLARVFFPRSQAPLLHGVDELPPLLLLALQGWRAVVHSLQASSRSSRRSLSSSWARASFAPQPSHGGRRALCSHILYPTPSLLLLWRAAAAGGLLPQRRLCSPSPWRHPLQLSLYLDASAAPCPPLHGHELHFPWTAPRFSRPQPWRPSLRTSLSMASEFPAPSSSIQKQQPCAAPLSELAPSLLFPMTSAHVSLSQPWTAPPPPLWLKHVQPYTAQLLAAEISPTAPQHWRFTGVRCNARVKLYVMNSSEVTVAVTSPSCAARIPPRRRRVSLQACGLAKTLFACEWGTSTK
jgi:hypothetical protein